MESIIQIQITRWRFSAHIPGGNKDAALKPNTENQLILIHHQKQNMS